MSDTRIITHSAEKTERINFFMAQVSNQQRRDREREEGDREYGVSKRMACMTAGREKQ
jgi:hypothetical protein